MSHLLQPFLQVSVSNPAKIKGRDIIEMLPPGWKTQFEEVICGIETVLNVEIIGVDIRDGVLYLTISPSQLTNVTLTNYVLKTLAQQSAQTCMVCGQYARRRKEQAHKPALCRTHYLEYINALEE